ncbi:MAG: hypothetical protein ACO1G9_07565 [Bacteroidota bacterium]
MSTYQTNPDLKRSRRSRQRQTQRQRLSAKQIFIGTSSILAAAITGMMIYFQIGHNESAKAAFQGDFRSVSSGNWHTPRIWETYNGSEWVISDKSPNAASNNIEICSGHSVIINTKITADQIVVSEDARLIAEKGALEIANGPGTDLLVKGDLEILGKIKITTDAQAEINNCLLSPDGVLDLEGKISVSGKFINNGGKMQVEADHITIKEKAVYEHAFDGGALPIAVWEKNSYCEITGVSMTLPQNLDQSFGNFKWNSAAQNISADLYSTISRIQNDLYISSTGTRNIFFDQFCKQTEIKLNGNLFIHGGTVCINAKGSNHLTVAGNVVLNSGELNFNERKSDQNSTLTISGDLNITGGTINMNTSASAMKGILNLQGNISVNGIGLITETSGAKGGEINFAGQKKTQFIVVNNNIKNRIDYNVSTGTTLRMDNYILTGNGDFNLSEGSGLMIGSPDGISKSEMSGNIQNKGARNFNSRATYIYNGGTEQETGNGLPSVVYALTINNEESCKLNSSTVVSNNLVLESGKIITGKNILTLGENATSAGNMKKVHGYVHGNFRRWISSNTVGKVEFPLGNQNSENAAVLNYKNSPSKGGTILCSLGIGNVNKIGLPMTDAGEVCMNAGFAYWNLIPENGYQGGTFDISLSAAGFPGIQNYEKLHVSQREDLYSPWRAIGKHDKATGTNENAVAVRRGVTQLGIFGITSTTANSLPTDMVYFSARTKNQHVELNWEMACEINNESFTIERSENGNDFTSISTIKGAGNSQVPQSYQFVDYKPMTGTSYYRLRQVNFEGKNTFSNVERVNLKAREAVASSVNIQRVGPNPFNSMVTAEYYAENNGDVAIEILSKEGQPIFKTYQYSVKGYNTFTYNKGSSLKPGEYMIRLSNANGATRQFITKVN